MKWALLIGLVGVWMGCGGDDTAGNQTPDNQNGEACNEHSDCAHLDAQWCENQESTTVLGRCEEGACVASEMTVACHTECDGDDCGDADPCAGIECEPPAPFCDGDTLVTTTSEGCAFGQCDFLEVETECDFGCENGACISEVCASVICDQPPADRCEETVAIRYGDGFCVDDNGEASCIYPEEWESCSYTLATCDAGECQGGIDQTGEVAIVEFMANPRGFFGGAGQWFDVVNTSGAPIDLEGWKIEVSFGLGGTISTHELVDPPAFPTGAQLLFAGSSDPAGDGSVTPDYQWSRQDVNLPQFHGWVRLVNSDDEIADFVYIEPGAVMRGHSRVFDPEVSPDALDNDDYSSWCPNLTDVLGAQGNYGRPGAVASPCVAEPCDGRSCDAPDPICLDDLTSRSYDDTGVECQVSRFNNPWCNFATDEEDCEAIGVCVAGVCEEPPADIPEVGELVITELMGDPSGPDADREWIEVYNPTDRELSLFGLRLEDNETGGAFDTYQINDPDAVIAPGGYAVLIRNTDPTVNGNISGGIYYNGGHLKDNPPEGMTILLVRPDGEVITEVHYGTPVTGRSQQLHASLYVGQGSVASSVLLDPESWCLGEGSYGEGGQGTPGADNLECPE